MIENYVHFFGTYLFIHGKNSTKVVCYYLTSNSLLLYNVTISVVKYLKCNHI